MNDWIWGFIGGVAAANLYDILKDTINKFAKGEQDE